MVSHHTHSFWYDSVGINHNDDGYNGYDNNGSNINNDEGNNDYQWGADRLLWLQSNYGCLDNVLINHLLCAWNGRDKCDVHCHCGTQICTLHHSTILDWKARICYACSEIELIKNICISCVRTIILLTRLWFYIGH